jgi:hypothetical protein
VGGEGKADQRWIKGKGGILTTRYVRQPFCKPAQTYTVCILIGLELCTGIWGTSGDDRDDRQDLALNTKSLSPLLSGLTAGDYIVIYI